MMAATKPAKLDFERLYEALTERIYGQDAALECLARHMSVAFVGLQNPERPLGVYMLAGPTGVGKSETARAVAEIIRGSNDGASLLVIDGSMVSDKHEGSVLFGSPPGFVRSDEPAMLCPERITSMCASNPYSIGVILFDEIEKASPEVTQAWLGLIDTGIGHNKNRPQVPLNIRRCFVFMTTNLGARDITRTLEGQDLGYVGHAEDIEKLAMRAIKRHFSPEFLARVDEIVIFRPLGDDAFRAIIAKMVEKMQGRLLQTGLPIVLRVDADAEDFLIQHVARSLGARAMQHELERSVMFQLAQMNLHNRQAVIVTVKDGKIRVI
jgi:ATP-dependent Clp protease ATP-binding subunit ClpC